MTARHAIRVLIACIGLMSALPALAAPSVSTRVQTAWRLLDYVAVDYSEAVRGGRVVNEAEYAEMLEFTATVHEHLRGLPPHDSQAALLAASTNLRAAIQAKRAPATVAKIAKGLGSDLLKAFPVPMVPDQIPDLARGASIYARQCASCHGGTGDGRGPAAAGMDPPPIAFTDRQRAAQRSVFALEQVIDQGLEGTAMPSFSDLSADDRWALALHVSRLAFERSDIARGKRLWSSNENARRQVPDLQALVSLTPSALAAQSGDAETAMAIMAYLRTAPQAFQTGHPGPLSLTRERLRQSVAAYRNGDPGAARQLALSAYLDGFEPVEPMLAARDQQLMRDIETAMARFREISGSEAGTAALEQQAGVLDSLFSDAERVLAQDAGTDLSTAVSSFTVLLREGVEAILIVIAMIAFLRKAERPEVLPYVHGGWIAALAAGAATWFAATTLVEISGASRELTEGFGALFAALVLVSVGIWMHGKSRAGAWQRYIAEKLDRALSRKSAWFLFLLAFVVVYREVFETILFFAAMWSPEREGAIVAGAVAGTAALAAIAWAMLRYSRHLPIGTFFRFSSILIAVLAVILAGKGIAALQEAGLFGVSMLKGVPRIDFLGLYPTQEVVIAQLLVAGALVAGFRWGHKAAPKDGVPR